MDAVEEELEAEWLEVVAAVAVVEVVVVAGTAGDAAALEEPVEALAGGLLDEVDLRAVDLLKLDGGLAGFDLFFEGSVEGVDGGFGEVDGLGEVEVVELLEVVSEDGVDLGDGADGSEVVGVADAFLLGELDGEEEERRVDAGVAFLFEVVPAEEC